jgi:hypothetical protein
MGLNEAGQRRLRAMTFLSFHVLGNGEKEIKTIKIEKW